MTFQLPPEPPEWRTWTLSQKVRWLQSHARPRPTYGDALRELSRRAAKVRAARAAAARAREKLTEWLTPSC